MTMSRWRSAGRVGRRGLLYGLIALPIAACGGEPAAAPRAELRAALEFSEVAIGTDPAVPMQYSTGDYLSVAEDGENHLVVFYDGGRIRGMRYDDVGRPLDLDGWIALGRNDENAGTQAYTDLAFGGGVYLAVFSDGSDDVSGMFAQGVRPDGSLLSAPVLVGEGAGYGSVVFNGTDFTVATYDGDIHLVRVGLDGLVVPGTQASVTTSGINNQPVLAMAGDVGLVVFEQDAGDGRKVYAARFDAAGTVLDPEGVLISDATTSSVNVSVAAGASEFLAVWSANSPRVVMGSVVSFDGSVPLKEFTISRSPADVGGGAVAHDGSQYLVVWEDGRSDPTAIYGTRVTAQGAPVDAEDVALTESSRAFQSWELDLTWTGDRYSLVYANNGIEGRFLDRELNTLDPGSIPLTVLPNAQGSAVSAWNGQTYVLGFSDERDSAASQLRSVRIDDAGNVLDPEGMAISPAGTRAYGGLASNGQVTLYSYRAYGDEQELVKRTLDADGVVSDPEPWLSGGEGGQIASNGATFLGLYSDGDNGNGNANEIWGQAFDENANVAGAATQIVTISRPRYGISPLGNEYLLAYSGQEIAGEPITGAVLRLSGEGEVLGEYPPVVEGMLSASSGGSSEQMLYSWQDETTEGLWGRLLHRDNGWGEPFVLTDQVAWGAPAIAWDGQKFVVVWCEDRLAMWSRDVMPDGSMTEPVRLLEGDYGYPRLTRGGGRSEQLLLSYERWLEFSRSRRVESRIIGPLGEGLAVPPDDPAAGGSAGNPAGGGSSGADPPSGGSGGDPQGQTSGGSGGLGAQGSGAETSGGSSGSSGSDPETAGNGPSGSGGASGAPSSGAVSTAADSEAHSEGGCSVHAAGGRPRALGWLGLLFTAMVLRRRRVRDSARTSGTPR